jgi:hypothetical protein
MNQTATNSMGYAAYFYGAKRASWSSRPCNEAGAPSHLFIRTPQHKGHPHPVLSRSTQGVPALVTAGSLPTELEARPHLALTTPCGIAMAVASDYVSTA